MLHPIYQVDKKAYNFAERKKKFGIYHWDFIDENEVMMIDERDDLREAIFAVMSKYEGRIFGSGADKVDIVDLEGNIVVQFNVG